MVAANNAQYEASEPVVVRKPWWLAIYALTTAVSLLALAVLLSGCQKKEPAPPMPREPATSTSTSTAPSPAPPPVVPASPAATTPDKPKPSAPPTASTEPSPAAPATRAAETAPREQELKVLQSPSILTQASKQLRAKKKSAAKESTAEERTATESTPSTRGADSAAADEEPLLQLPKGSAVLAAPKQAKQYEPFTVTLRVANQELGALTESTRRLVPSATLGGVGGVRISHYMRAVLVGSDFVIEPKSTELDTQYVSFAPDEPTQWTWQVTPQSWGENRTLVAHVYTLQQPDSKFAWREVDVKDVSVKVSISPIGLVRTYSGEITSAVVLPLLGWAAKEWWERRRKKSAGSADDTTAFPPIEVEDKKAA